MAKSAADTALENLRARMEPLKAELNGLRIAEAALIDASALEALPEKTTKKRGRRRRGAPTVGDPADEATRMSAEGNSAENYAKPSGRGAI